MNKFAKKMMRREGFTLVELIVVIAILGILAGIAIPVYSGYITKAHDASDLQQLDAIKTAAVFAATEVNNDFGKATKIVVSASNGTISGVTITNGTQTLDSTKTTEPDKTFGTELNNLLGVETLDKSTKLEGSYKVGATWSNEAKEAVAATGTSPAQKALAAGWNVG